MLVTKDFVVLNLPKTGSTFVRRVLKKIYYDRKNKNIICKALLKFNIIYPDYKEFLMPHATRQGYKDQHGTYFQIPNKYKDKQIIAVLRNPFERFESQYTFKWWAKHPEIEKDTLEKYFPEFPNLNINEYVVMRKIHTNNMKLKFKIKDDIRIGDQTIQFINMFFKDPKTVLSNIDEEYMNGDDFINDIADIKFLKQENLNEELSNFLKNYGFTNSELEFVKSHKKENVSSIKKKLLNTETINFIKESEWFLFKILNHFGFNYNTYK